MRLLRASFVCVTNRARNRGVVVSIAPASFHASDFMRPLGCLSLVWLVNLKRHSGGVA